MGFSGEDIAVTHTNTKQLCMAAYTLSTQDPASSTFQHWIEMGSRGPVLPEELLTTDGCQSKEPFSFMSVANGKFRTPQRMSPVHM